MNAYPTRNHRVPEKNWNTPERKAMELSQQVAGAINLYMSVGCVTVEELTELTGFNSEAIARYRAADTNMTVQEMGVIFWALGLEAAWKP